MRYYEQLKRTAAIFTKLWGYLRLSSHPEADCRNLKERYAKEMRRHLRFEMREINRQKIQGPVIYVCNHLSYVDIPILAGSVPEASFVSKSEVASYPIIGTAARRIETVFVKRESKESRNGIRKALTESLMIEKKSIIVFPSGTTTIYKTERWRKGAFEIAHECQIPIVPLRLNYEPLREVAYIDDDTLVFHMFNLVAQSRLRASLEFGEPIMIRNPIQDCESVKAWCEEYMDYPTSIAEEAAPVIS